MNGAAPMPNTANDISTTAKFLDREVKQYYLLREKYRYSEFFWSVFRSNTVKHGSEKLQARTLFTLDLFNVIVFVSEEHSSWNEVSD